MRYCCLHDLLKNKKNLIGVEIGVWQGLNAIGLLQNLKISRLYLIDPYVGYEDSTQGKGILERNFDEAKDLAKSIMTMRPVVWIYEKSEDAVEKVNDKLDFVYIDGCHQFDYVLKDIEIWYPKIINGGIVAGHDPNTDDVIRAVTEFCSRDKIKFEVRENPEHEWWFIKEEK